MPCGPDRRLLTGGPTIPPTQTPLHPTLRETLSTLAEDGREIWAHFDRTVRQDRWHPFVCANYEAVLEVLIDLHTPGLRLLEWGSATGVITIMADLLGYEAYGIELDETLVAMSRELATRYQSNARFVAGSFFPTGYRWRSKGGDRRTGTLGEGPSGYLQLGLPLEEFDLVYAYPWDGEGALMQDLVRRYARPGAGLCLARPSGTFELFRDGVLEAAWGPRGTTDATGHRSTDRTRP